MTGDHVDLIESQLGVTLPVEYRTFVLDYPSDLQPFAGEHEIFADHDAVVQNTLERRLLGCGDTAEPELFVVIGTSGASDWYFLDLTRTPAPVMFQNRQSGAISTAAPSFAAWSEQLLDLYGCADA